MLRLLLGIGLAIHGMIHLIGFVVPWRLVEIRGFEYTTATGWGRFELSSAGAKALGLGWLVGAALFVMAAVGVWLGSRASKTVMSLLPGSTTRTLAPGCTSCGVSRRTVPRST